MTDGKIKMHKLPLAALIQDDDIFIIENDTTTQKISLGSLINYIKKHEEILDYFVKQSSVDSAGGIAPLDGSRKVPCNNLPLGSTENTILDGALGKSLSDSLSAHLADKDNPHALTKSQIGLSDVDNTADTVKPVSAPQQKAIDAAYAGSNAYTDAKIAELIDGAPSTLDTLGKIAKALQDGSSIGEALDAAIAAKASQEELDAHAKNDTLHITASERAKWNNKMEASADASNTTVTFSEAPSLSPINTGEKTGDIMGKISKAVTSLIGHISSRAAADSFGHVKLSDTYRNAVSEGAAANGMGASQKALADAYSALNNNLTDSLGGITFGVDANGNYGYIKAGADTVTPFKTDSPRELNLYGSANVTYIFLLDSADYSAYNIETAGGYLNSSRVIFFKVPDLDSNISIFSTAPVIKTVRWLGYCFREDGTISQQDDSAGWATMFIPENGLYTFTLREISEQYPSLTHGGVVGLGLYQYATASMGNHSLNSTVKW